MGEAFIRKKSRVTQENEIVVVKDGQFQTGFSYVMRYGHIVFYNNYFTLQPNINKDFTLAIQISEYKNINVSKIRIKSRKSTFDTADQVFNVYAFDIDKRTTGYSYFTAGPSWETTDADLYFRPDIPTPIPVAVINIQYGNNAEDIDISDISLFVEEAL